ncbi:hypothetical protein [Pseudomonas sp. 10S4]|uniref:hypothetical protein n=1 Tax=Pseudomonas sp. 10S4 TaxID=3048583 RepID=UPI002B22559F|nr:MULTISPECIES: hypothetical protein [unclassified Pseudomonas]MEB0225551.1 hypothetical protein [Pseudomonas sp. 5S1]MEB0293554.1 hypothetical protein [Pseudomonas sp. 10S4]
MLKTKYARLPLAGDYEKDPDIEVVYLPPKPVPTSYLPLLAISAKARQKGKTKTDGLSTSQLVVKKTNRNDALTLAIAELGKFYASKKQ